MEIDRVRKERCVQNGFNGVRILHTTQQHFLRFPPPPVKKKTSTSSCLQFAEIYPIKTLLKVKLQKKQPHSNSIVFLLPTSASQHALALAPVITLLKGIAPLARISKIVPAFNGIEEYQLKRCDLG